MVNTEEFTKRLHLIMDFYELSAAAFADKIDVGRSSISHLLSGRNKPSLDFVMKIVQAFPEVELYWLLNGKGKFPGDSEKSRSQHTKKPDLTKEEGEPEASKAAFDPKNKKQVQKIVIFYTDGGFDAFEN